MRRGRPRIRLAVVAPVLALAAGLGAARAGTDDAATARFLGRGIPALPAEAAGIAGEGEGLLARFGPASPYYCAVAFRTGTLWRVAGRSDEARRIYREALAKARPSPSQLPILWNDDAATLAESDPKAAIAAYERALATGARLDREDRERIKSTLADLRLTAGTGAARRAEARRLLKAVRDGDRDEDLRGRVQTAYASVPEYGPKFSEAIFARLARGHDGSDLELAVGALSSDPRVTDPTTAVAKPYVAEVTRRLSAPGRGAGIWLQGQWAMALGDSASGPRESERALRFATGAVRALRGPYTPEEREDAANLVHALETMVGPNDAAARRLIRAKLAELGAGTIVRVHPSPPGSPAREEQGVTSPRSRA